MGLGLYVNGRGYAHWSYSGFNQFRRKVAEAIGINLERMEGFALEDSSPSCKKWETINDPLVPLLNHSDCDGKIPAELCGVIADSLEVIISNWPDTLVLEFSEIGNYDKIQAKGLIEGLRTASSTGHPLEFH